MKCIATRYGVEDCKRILTDVLREHDVFDYFTGVILHKSKDHNMDHIAAYNDYLDRTYMGSWFTSFSVWGGTRQGRKFWSQLNNEFKDIIVRKDVVPNKGQGNCKSIW